MILYAYSKCSTCQKALRFLTERNIPFILKEIKDEPPSIEELQVMLSIQDGNIKKLFNTSGLMYREMQLSGKLNDMPQNLALELLSKYGMLVKRPFLLGNNVGLLGFNESEWSTKL